jgi:hypothetical protein
MQKEDGNCSRQILPKYWDLDDLTDCLERTDVLQTTVQFPEKFLDILLGKQDGSERFLTLIPHLLERPYEIWLQVYKGIDTGVIRFVRFYIGGYQADGGHFILILQCDPLGGKWIASDLFEVTQEQVNELRSGFLEYPEPKS